MCTCLTRQRQERVLDGKTTPVGPCPDESFLNSLARNSKHVALSDPRLDHAANCPICMKQLLNLCPQSGAPTKAGARRRCFLLLSDCRRFRCVGSPRIGSAASGRQHCGNSEDSGPLERRDASEWQAQPVSIRNFVCRIDEGDDHPSPLQRPRSIRGCCHSRSNRQ